MKYSF